MDWLKDIEDPVIRAQAVKNRIAYLKIHPEEKGRVRSDMRNALDAAFVWQNTPQGHKYWQNVQREN